MRVLKQSTARNVMVFMTDSADHITGKTGLTLTITASKDGAAFGSITPTVTERGDGWYNLALTTSHTDTLGDLAVHITGSGADPTDFLAQIVAYDPTSSASLGLSNLDATVSSRSTLSQNDVANAVWNAATGDYTTPETLGGEINDLMLDVIEILADTGTTIPAQISALPLISAADVWASGTRTLTAGTNIVLAKGTGITGFNDISAAQVNAEVDTALADVGLTTTVTGRIDAAISSRMATFSYTAPDNAGIGDIKTKTDQLAFTSGSVNANIEYVNAVEVVGTGSPGNEWGPA